VAFDGGAAEFVSHCGWNSVAEREGETCDGSVRGFVRWDGLKKAVRELMEGEKASVGSRLAAAASGGEFGFFFAQP
jgi:hypothetical protein